MATGDSQAIFRFALPSVTCGVCTGSIESAIEEYLKNSRLPQKLPIKQFHADAVTKVLNVVLEEHSDCTYDQVKEVLVQVIGSVGHDCQTLFSENLKGSQQKQFLTNSNFFRSHSFQGVAGTALGLSLLILPLLPITLPWVAMLVMTLVSILATLILGAEFFLRAKKQLETFDPAMDLLFALSALAAISVSILALFIPGLPMMCEAGVLIFGFRHLGIALRNSVIQALGTSQTYQALVPDKLIRLNAEQCPVETKSTEVKPGDLMVVLPGEIVPYDGQCVLTLENSALDRQEVLNSVLPLSSMQEDEAQIITEKRLVLTTNIDGFPFPKSIDHGATVLAGTRLFHGEKNGLLVRVSGKRGYELQVCYQQPNLKKIDKNIVYLYLDHGKIAYCAQDGAGQVRVILSEDAQWTDRQGVQYAPSVREVLQDKTQKKQLSKNQIEQVFTVTSKQGFPAHQLDSYLERLDQGIREAKETKPSIVKHTTFVLRYFVPTVLLLACASGFIISFFFPWSIALQCALSVLVAACPCTLGLITPLAIKVGLEKAAACGIRFNHAASLEDMESIDTVIFDLHGTLTKAQLSVDRSRSQILDPEMSENEFLSCLSSLEQYAKHPVGQVVYAWSKSQTPHLLQANEIDSSNHAGLTARINDQIYHVGNQSMLQAQGVVMPQDLLEMQANAGETFVYLARDKKILGYVVVRDPLREDAIQAIQLLQKQKKACYIVTGADSQTALGYAKALNIPASHVFSDCDGVKATSQSNKKDKKTCVEQIPGMFKLFVGDGANDSVAMEVCTTSIAIKHSLGDSTIEQTAGAVIETGALCRVVTALELGKLTMQNVKQNLIFSLIYNFVAISVAGGLLLSMGVVLNPGVYAALMIIQTSLVFSNILLFQSQKLTSVPLSKTTGFDDESHSSYQHVVKNIPIKMLQPRRKATLHSQALPEQLSEKMPLRLIQRPQYASKSAKLEPESSWTTLRP